MLAAAERRRRVATSRRREKAWKTKDNKNHDAQMNDDQFNSDGTCFVGKITMR